MSQPPTSPLPRDPRPGERRGDITFAAKIKEGMSANLYLAWHHRFNSVVVCKMLRAEDWDYARWRSLLFNEGSILSRVVHPNIVRIFATEREAVLPYLLLEYLPGQPVRQILRKKGKFSLQDALRLTMYLAATLGYVHQLGFIHRDIKPSNVMMHGGWLTLLDFGVALPISQEPPPDKSGTPRYLSPEQCRQDILNPTVDIWALGLFLFELLTGKLPFPEGDHHNYEASLAVRYPQLVTPPKTIKSAGRRVPGGVESVVNRCLSFDPLDRYQTVKELLIALDPFCESKIWPALPQNEGSKPDLASFI